MQYSSIERGVVVRMVPSLLGTQSITHTPASQLHPQMQCIAMHPQMQVCKCAFKCAQEQLGTISAALSCYGANCCIALMLNALYQKLYQCVTTFNVLHY